MKRFALGALLALLVVGAGIFAWMRLRAPAVPVGFTMGNGRLEATEVDIATKLPGRIQEVLVREGDTVESGEVVVRMDTRSLEAQLRHAEAQVEKSRSARVSAEAEVKQRQSEFGYAQKEYRRAQELSERNIISTQKLDQARTSRETARAALDAARSRVVQEQSAIAADIAEVERLKTEIDDSILRSPVHGRVQYRLAEPGEVLPSGGRVLTILDLTDVYMTVFLPEIDAGKVAIGAEARILLDAAPQWPVRAKVSYVAAKAQFTPKTVETASERQKLVFRVKVQLDPKLLRRYEPWVKVGLPGVAYIQLDPRRPWPKELTPRLPPEIVEKAGAP